MPAVYIKLPFHHTTAINYHQTGHHYIGSTNIGIYKREFNRQAKLKQLRQLKPPHVELAIRWWHTNSTIFLHSAPTYSHAWAQKHALIQQHRSPLNFPYIQQHLRRTAFHSTSNPTSNTSHAHTPPHDFGAEYAEQQHHSTGITHPPKPASDNGTHSTTLLHTPNNGLKPAKYSDQAPLQTGMSTHFGDWHNMWNNLNDPAAFLNSATSSAFETAPHPNRTSLLQYPTFQKQTQAWLRRHIIANKNMAIPLHLATHRAREQAHLSINSILHNFMQAVQMLTFSESKSHIAARSTLSPYPHTFNTTDTAMDSAQHTPHGTATKTKSPPHSSNGSNITTTSPPHPAPPTMAPTQTVPQHTHQISSPRSLPTQKTHHAPLRHSPHRPRNKQTTHLLPPTSTHEQLKPHGMIPTATLHIAPADINQQLIQSIPTWLVKKNAWGINQQSTLPHGFTFLKSKKNWNKGRTIISYRKSTLAKLLQAKSIALDTILKQTWPAGPGNPTTPAIWAQLHDYLAHIPPETSLSLINDDLIGFFNSVPHEKLHKSLTILLHQWRQQHEQDVITIDMSRTLGPIHSVHTGSFRTTKRIPTHRVLHLDHIPDIIHLSFQFSIFQALGHTWE